jgi:hypothetical protein
MKIPAKTKKIGRGGISTLSATVWQTGASPANLLIRHASDALYGKKQVTAISLIRHGVIGVTQRPLKPVEYTP